MGDVGVKLMNYSHGWKPLLSPAANAVARQDPPTGARVGRASDPFILSRVDLAVGLEGLSGKSTRRKQGRTGRRHTRSCDRETQRRGCCWGKEGRRDEDVI